MPYTTNVAGTTITAAWGNANVRDQVVTPFASAAARTSAITSPVEGMLSYRSDNKVFEGYDGTGWIRVPSTLFAYKTADETVTSSTTNQDDDHLTMTVQANAVYRFLAYFKYSAHSSGDLKFGFTGPAGATLDWTGHALLPADTGTSAPAIWITSEAITRQDFTVGGVGAENTSLATVWIFGTLQTTSSGTFKLQWSQGTSNGTGTIMRAGSWMSLDKMA